MITDSMFIFLMASLRNILLKVFFASPINIPAGQSRHIFRVVSYTAPPGHSMMIAAAAPPYNYALLPLSSVASLPSGGCLSVTVEIF